MDLENRKKEAFVVRTGRSSSRINFYFNTVKCRDLKLDYLLAFCSELLQEIKSKQKDSSKLRFESEQVGTSAILLRTWIYITLLGLPPFKDSNISVRQILIDLDGFLERIVSQDQRNCLKKTTQKNYEDNIPCNFLKNKKEGRGDYEMR